MAMPIRTLTLALVAATAQGCTSTSPQAPEPASGVVRLQLIFNSTQCGQYSGGASVTLVSAPGQWANAWRRITSSMVPAPALPEMDFSTTRIAVVSGGRFTTGGYGLQLRADTAKMEEGVLRLPVAVTQPTPGNAVPQAMTTPCLAITFHAPAVTRVEALGVASAPNTQFR
ncbi:MAG: protease complex subunit PrcB family protein [Rhodocyclaceae bacterium]|nr:protease complex subunit PrcB family protein [Rhodocyclaceae bacterium]